MKKNISRIISIVLVMVMICGYAVLVSASPKDTITSDKAVAKKTGDSLDLSDAINTEDADKQETVYVIAGADGSVQKVIVSEFLKNKDNASEIKDFTNLTDIVNVKSDAAYTLSNGSCVWDAEGEDIYYQGNTTQEVPVLLSISFKLDGKTVTADEMSGASGKAEITFNYKNTQKETVEIDGKKEEIYVPFLMLSGMILSNENFKNVTVDNGKVISDGDKSIVMGYALPGLQENLGIDEDTFAIPSSVTVTADVTDFSLATTLTLATNDIFNHVDIDSDDTIDELQSQLDTLEDSTLKLIDGSSQLYAGLSELLEKSGELVDGVKKLADGAALLSAGADKLYTGITFADSKIAELSDGLNKLSSNSATLDAGAKQVFTTLLSTVQTQLGQAGLADLGIKVPTLTIDNYAAELDKLITALDETKVKEYATSVANKTVTEQVKANEAEIKAGVTAAVKEQVKATIKETVVTPMVKQGVLAQVLATKGLTAEAYAKLPAANKAAIDAAVDAQMKTEAVQNMITAQMSSKDVTDAVNAQMATEEIKKTIDKNVTAQEDKLIKENMAGKEVTTKINNAVAKAKAGVTSIKTAKESLNSYKTFYAGLLEYTAGVDTAASGSTQISAGFGDLVSGSKQLSDKLKELVAGVNTLNSSAPALVDGVTQLTDGAKTLSEGLQQYYDEGIKTIIDKIDDITPVVTRLKATIDVSKDYQSFGGISEDMTGSVKFIYRTDSIG